MSSHPSVLSVLSAEELKAQEEGSVRVITYKRGEGCFHPNRRYYSSKNYRCPASHDARLKRERLVEQYRKEHDPAHTLFPPCPQRPNQSAASFPPPPRPDGSISTTSTPLEKTKEKKRLDDAVYWDDWKAYHLSQIVKYFKEMRSFPVVGKSAFSLLWKSKFVPNPHVQQVLQGLGEEDFIRAAAAIQ